MNKKIRELEDKIIATLNESDVPIEAKRLIIANVLNLVMKEADKVIAYEIQEGGNKNGSKTNRDSKERDTNG